eukprot:jgi/Ulvmu1/10500/UM064_0038.1
MASALNALRWGHRSHKKCTCTSQRSVACRVRNVDYPEALLFDCDGVLVDTELDGHRVAFNKAFKEKGLRHEWDADVYGKLLEIGGGKERMNAYFSEHADTEPFLSITNPEEQAKFLKEIHLLKTGIFQEMIEAGQMPLRPGVKELVADAMDVGVQLAVCSTSNEKAVQTIVDVLLSEASSAMPVFAGDIVPAKKPDPAIYKLAAEKLGVDPTRCVVVEDSFIGLQAARAAGMRCVVTTSSYTQNEDFSIADAVFDCIGDNFRIDDLTTPGTFWLNPPLPMDVNGNWVDPPKSPYGESWVGIDVDLER